MTARLDVTPKTTEQNRIVRTGKSEAEVIKNCVRGIVLLKLSTDRHEASRGLFGTAELLVFNVVLVRRGMYSPRVLGVDASLAVAVTTMLFTCRPS